MIKRDSKYIGPGTTDRLLKDSPFEQPGTLAREARINQATLHQIQHGADFRITTLEKMADAMGIPAWELLRKIEQQAS